METTNGVPKRNMTKDIWKKTNWMDSQSAKVPSKKLLR